MPDVRLTTIGTGTGALSPTRVRAGHLVECGGSRVLLDCGSGVTFRLGQLGIDWMGITHVALTHFHDDHIGDLTTLIAAWRWGAIPYRSAPIEIIGPPGTEGVLDRLAAVFGSWVREPGFPVAVRELASGEALELPDGLRLGSRKVPHTDESVAYSMEHDGRRLVYTGDMGFDATFGDWAHGCDLLLCECSLPDTLAIPQHLTPRQCGALAALARPGCLVLTHLYPPVEAVDVHGEVGERFSGAVVIAADGWSIEL